MMVVVVVMVVCGGEGEGRGGYFSWGDGGGSGSVCVCVCVCVWGGGGGRWGGRRYIYYSISGNWNRGVLYLTQTHHNQSQHAIADLVLALVVARDIAGTSNDAIAYLK